MELLRDFENADTVSIDTLALEDMILQERAREIDELHILSKKVSCLHTNMLYYRKVKTDMGAICFDIWKTIIKLVGGVSKCWMELGVHLGIPRDELNYIGSSMKDDPTDIVLKVFIQSEDATLDKLVNSFIKMERYDILKAIENQLTKLAQCFYKEEDKSDTGYHSTSKCMEMRQIISLNDVPNDLPPVLRSKTAFIFDEKIPQKPKPPVKQYKDVVEKSDNEKPTILLTFAEDGQETALNIQNHMHDLPEDFPTVSIITLNEKKENVLQNPESFIREYFEKADYVIPIVTAGYLNAIRQHTPNIPNVTDNLDYKYVHFIHTLLTNNYIHLNGCLNRKVLSVIPEDVDMNVMMDITFFPHLMPYTDQNSFLEVFQMRMNNEMK